MMNILVWIYGCGQQNGMEIMNIKEKKEIMAFLGWQNIAIWRPPKTKWSLGQVDMNMQLVPIFEGMVQCVKSFGTFNDIGKDIGMLHISEVSHACVTNMDVMFVVGEKVKVSLN
jgi:polyribonucleotide nucleotidyltransferase